MDDFIQSKIFTFLNIDVGLHDISKICNMGECNNIIRQMLWDMPLCHRSFLVMLLVAMEISCVLSGNYHKFQLLRNNCNTLSLL